MKNTGKGAEQIFDDSWARLGKQAFVFKFSDTAELRGLNKGKSLIARAQPSDRLLVYKGETYFAEIKSTIDPDRFKFSLLRSSQGFAAAAALAAGGAYYVFIHNMDQDRWYRLPYEAIQQAKARKAGSLTWAELEPYAWSFPLV